MSGPLFIQTRAPSPDTRARRAIPAGRRPQAGGSSVSPPIVRPPSKNSRHWALKRRITQSILRLILADPAMETPPLHSHVFKVDNNEVWRLS